VDRRVARAPQAGKPRKKKTARSASPLHRSPPAIAIMSLFAAMADENSVWSKGSSLFNISSPLNDLLDTDSFTLEQVLEEDELIQEVKTRNTKLLEL
jgi:hypothetical protein